MLKVTAALPLLVKAGAILVLSLLVSKMKAGGTLYTLPAVELHEKRLSARVCLHAVQELARHPKKTAGVPFTSINKSTSAVLIV